MKRLFVKKSPTGSITGVELEGGVLAATVQEVYAFLKSEEKDVFYLSSLHELVVAMESTGFKVTVFGSERNGRILKARVGKATLVDLSSWGIEVDFSEEVRESIESLIELHGAPLGSSPTYYTIDGFRKTVFKLGSVDRVQEGRMTFQEAMACSSRAKGRVSKPAYSGGLISSPADPRKVYENVISYDISSSYPWSAASSLVPVGESWDLDPEQLFELNLRGGILQSSLGFIGTFRFEGLRRRSHVRIPLLKSDDSIFGSGVKTDRLGIISAEVFMGSFSKPDLTVMELQYEWDLLVIESLTVHKLGRLDPGAVYFLTKIYSDKQNSSGAKRLTAKLAINSIIGCWGIDPFSGASEEVQPWDALYRYNGSDERPGVTSGGKRCWDYRQAVYALAEARLRMVRLEKELSESGFEILYADTDSIKFAGDHELARDIMTEHNAQVFITNAKLDLPLSMGRWEDESRGFHRACFRSKKFYIQTSRRGINKVNVAGVLTSHAEELSKVLKPEDAASMEDITISTTRPSIAELENSFGATKQIVNRRVDFIYSPKGEEIHVR